MTVPEEKLAGKITDREVKRVNYFDTQFLKEADFQDEQAYQIRLRRANKSRHSWLGHHRWIGDPTDWGEWNCGQTRSGDR